MRGGFLRLGLRDARHRLPFGEGLSEGRGKTMSEENKEVTGKEAAAAAGIPGVGGGGGGESVDWRKRAEEAERELNKARVEQGRVKSLDSGTGSLRKSLRRSEARRRTTRCRKSFASRFQTRPRRLRSTSPGTSPTR